MAVNVAYLISTLADSGPVNVLWGIVRNLNRQYFRPVIITLSPEPAPTSYDRFAAAGVEIHQMQLSRIGSLLSGRARLCTLLTEIQPAIIHCHGFRATLLAAKAAKRYPSVATLHCDLERYYSFTYGRLLGIVMAYIEYTVLRRYAAVVTVSETVGDAALAHGIASSTIRNGIDLTRYSPPRDLDEKMRIRRHLGWPENSLVILHTGVLSSGKRPLEVIRAFLALPPSTRATLVFAGAGPLKLECKKAARGSESVIFLGRRSDVPDLLRAADLLISYSESEGLPLALLEACAAGLHILATDIPSHRIIWKMFPDRVFLCEADLTKSLALAVETVGVRGQQLFHDSSVGMDAISDEAMARAYEQIYRKVLAHPQGVGER